MYPLTHLYVTKQVLGKLTPALALGSVLPDVLVGVGMHWKEAHSQKSLPHQELLLGNLIHGISLPGLDYYSDCSYQGQEGYAFQYAHHLKNDLAHLGVPKEHTLWRGHNFIEMAIEVMLNQTESNLWQQLELSFHDVELKKIIYSFLHQNNYNKDHLVDLVLTRFLNIRGKIDRLASDYAKKLNNIYHLQLSAADCQKLTLKSKELIINHYKLFIKECCQQIKHDIKHFS